MSTVLRCGYIPATTLSVNAHTFSCIIWHNFASVSKLTSRSNAIEWSRSIHMSHRMQSSCVHRLNNQVINSTCSMLILLFTPINGILLFVYYFVKIKSRICGHPICENESAANQITVTYYWNWIYHVSWCSGQRTLGKKSRRHEHQMIRLHRVACVFFFKCFFVPELAA